MTHVLVTGGTGYAGKFIVEDLLAAGHMVTIAARTPPEDGAFSRSVAFRPLDLEPGSDHADLVDGTEVLVHAAFHHVPARYRGGEGDDPATFIRLNRDGSTALFKAAKAAGMRRCIFLSSRAVYGTRAAGTRLSETTDCWPDTLYGKVKLATEEALASLSADDFLTVNLRITGVYGASRPGGWHKWRRLFEDYRTGRPIEPRAGTEVHGSDMAGAVRLMLTAPAGRIGGRTFNVSDLLVDRRDLLWLVKEETGIDHPLPERSRDLPNVMETSRIEALGWNPGGVPLLRQSVRALT